MLKIKAAKKATEEKIVVNMLVKDAAQLWKPKQMGETESDEPSVLIVCAVAAQEMLKLKLESEENEKRKGNGLLSLMASLRKAIQSKLAQVELEEELSVE